MDHPRVDHCKRQRSKGVRFTPGSRALGGGRDQRQGQPIGTLRLGTLRNLSGEFSQEEVAQEEARTSSRDEISSQVGEPRESPTGPRAIPDNGTPELSTAVELLPRTPHFAAIVRAAAGSRLEGVADLSQPARSEPQPDLAPLDAPLRRIRDVAAMVIEQLQDLDAATSKIIPPLQTATTPTHAPEHLTARVEDDAARQDLAIAAPQISTGGGSSALPTAPIETIANSDELSRAGSSSAGQSVATSSAASSSDAAPSTYLVTHVRQLIHSTNDSVDPRPEPRCAQRYMFCSVGHASTPCWVWRFA